MTEKEKGEKKYDIEDRLEDKILSEVADGTKTG